MKTVDSGGARLAHSRSRKLASHVSDYRSGCDFQGNEEIRTQVFPLPRVNSYFQNSIHRGLFVFFQKGTKNKWGEFLSPNSHTQPGK